MNELSNNHIFKSSEEVDDFVPKPIEIDWGLYDNWEDAADAMDAEKVRIDTEKVEAQEEADKKNAENIVEEPEVTAPELNENNITTV